MSHGPGSDGGSRHGTVGGKGDRLNDNDTVWEGRAGDADVRPTIRWNGSEGSVKGVGERTGGIAPRRSPQPHTPEKEGGLRRPRRGAHLGMLVVAFLLLVGIPVGGFVLGEEGERNSSDHDGKKGHVDFADGGRRGARRRRNMTKIYANGAA